MAAIQRLIPNPTSPIYRFVITSFVFGIIVWKALRLPSRLLPSKKLRAICELWSSEMRWSVVKSFGTRYPHDELCVLRRPETYSPKVDVDPRYRLSEEDIRHFYEYGFVRPFPVFSAEKMRDFRDHMLEFRQQKSKIYGFPCDRDRHLELPEMMRMILEPAIVERLAQLLGPDLLVWRSQIFYKPPMGKRVGWHQASTYWFESSFADRVMIPQDVNELFQLTVWIPADPATLQTGCLQLVKGSLLEGIRWMRLGGTVGFHAVNYMPDYKVDPASVVNIEMEPGQVLIFSERTIHGSPPNTTDRHRFAFNYRVIPTSTRVYCNTKRFHKAAQMQEIYDLKDWRAILIRGEDRYHLNPTAPWQDYVEESTDPRLIIRPSTFAAASEFDARQ